MRKLFYIILMLWAFPALAACPGGSTCVTGTPWQATNAALKAATGGYTANVYRAGYYAAGDGGDAFYTWNGSSSCTDDGGSCIQPNSGSGRWILNNNGAVSVKVFGARCDASNDDTVAINAALSVITAVFVPANTSCRVNMTTMNGANTSGIRMNDGNHLFGQNENTSLIYAFPTYNANFDWVAAGKFGPGVAGTGVVVASNVGTVTTGWSHNLAAGATITIGGSATTALNHTYTVVAITAPDKFTITTSGVSDGTYTDPTSVVSPSGIGASMIRSAVRDSGNFAIAFEVDHLKLNLFGGSAPPLTYVDLTGTNAARIHGMTIIAGTNLGATGILCADVPPLTNSFLQSCFFNNIYSISVSAQTPIHITLTGNAGTNVWQQIHGSGRVMMDTTGSNNSPGGGVFSQAYFGSDNDVNSWDIYGGIAPEDATFMAWSCEGCPNTFAHIGANHSTISTRSIAQTLSQPANTVADFPSLRLAGSIAADIAIYDTNGPFQLDGHHSTVICGFGSGVNTALTLPAAPNYSLADLGGQIITFRAQPTSTCTISPYTGTFTGYISGTTLTVSTNSGNTKIAPGQYLTGAGVAGGTTITVSLFGSGNGSSGNPGSTFVVNNAQTVGSSGSPVTFTVAQTIDGGSGAYVLNGGTLTLQFMSSPNSPDWRTLFLPAQKLPIYTVATLPSCGASQAGLFVAVSDALTPTYNGALTGGSSTKIPVYCTGSAWTAH